MFYWSYLAALLRCCISTNNVIKISFWYNSNGWSAWSTSETELSQLITKFQNPFFLVSQVYFVFNFFVRLFKLHSQPQMICINSYSPIKCSTVCVSRFTLEYSIIRCISKINVISITETNCRMVQCSSAYGTLYHQLQNSRVRYYKPPHGKTY